MTKLIPNQCKLELLLSVAICRKLINLFKIHLLVTPLHSAPGTEHHPSQQIIALTTAVLTAEECYYNNKSNCKTAVVVPVSWAAKNSVLLTE